MHLHRHRSDRRHGAREARLTWLAIAIAAYLFGAASAAGLCWLWAMRAMHPHDELSELERYAMRRAEGIE